MAKKSKKSKKSNKVDFEMESSGDVKLEIHKIFSREEHSENSFTVLWLVSWNDGDQVYEKRTLYKKGEATKYRCGRAKGVTEKEMMTMING